MSVGYRMDKQEVGKGREWIDKFQDIPIIEYYVMKKTNKPKLHAITSIGFTNIMLNEKSWIESNTCSMIPFL